VGLFLVVGCGFGFVCFLLWLWKLFQDSFGLFPPWLWICGSTILNQFSFFPCVHNRHTRLFFKRAQT
jgi:hypothetical protein